jgi:hypothetical protein
VDAALLGKLLAGIHDYGSVGRRPYCRLILTIVELIEYPIILILDDESACPQRENARK